MFPRRWMLGGRAFTPRDLPRVEVPPSDGHDHKGAPPTKSVNWLLGVSVKEAGRHYNAKADVALTGDLR
jgi:hypothetical protein